MKRFRVCVEAGGRRYYVSVSAADSDQATRVALRLYSSATCAQVVRELNEGETSAHDRG